MTDGLANFAAFAVHCQTLAVANGPIFLALFLAGLVGSASHCVGMCGPFVLAQTAERMSALRLGDGAIRHELRRLDAALATPYQLGRATTYVLLGALLATPFGLVAQSTGWPYLAPVLLAVAALLFAWQAMRGMEWGVAGAARLPDYRIAEVTRSLLRTPFGWRGYVLGLLLGFLPCGLLYGALAAAAATADPLAAAFGMFGFVLGTVPALLTVGYLGGVAATRWRPLARRAMPFVAGFNAVILLVMSVRALPPA
ncbi:MAG: sulfite exporter TauE/SafE family protein [Rhodospirillaceae bacterium]|nr:sulfite exporter TauE/SafE family protein [Rhodospirillaceae bacterium]